ncbi:hypothetical protein BDV32DRAFT_130966 [Aspergillus pseudonomiae]|uniref:Uncharacterized protein n=1 Tax=Aspergillus pseudonomiae TaxID=1506151 RepID=A0A5N7DCC8_9EURO|nr:uncharacterized protein BDV37DRAFT_118872 [Aspergillus pseudonomiae]KAB8255300.1 hypothetical protein BDV32DRAFT_130966 [Aspergillus pseudonomiae]KAE8404126.1 hypothetical protein BDV37DRAFT_118872 [Aspergillus pseudonomiae]
MNLRAAGLRKARRQPSFTWILLVIAVLMMAHISFAQDTTANDPAPTTDVSTKETTKATTHDDTTTTSKTTKESTTDKPATTTTTESSTSTDSSTTSTATNDYPVVTVPPLADAPYMQTSDTPEGTVFIAVGAVLGFLGLALLAWRGMVAWSVNRSVRKAAIMQSSEAKGLLRHRRKRSAHRSHGGPAPAVSLEKMSGGHRTNPRSSKGPRSNSGLFFSPTAGMHSGGNRGSSYLPAGYYAAGNTAAGSGSHQSMQFSAPDLPGMGPQAQGYTRTKSGPSPPGTPTHAPGGVYEPQFNTSRYSHVASNSSVNLASPTQGRTPSAYLEDLFENPPPHNRQ